MNRSTSKNIRVISFDRETQSVKVVNTRPLGQSAGTSAPVGVRWTQATC